MAHTRLLPARHARLATHTHTRARAHNIQEHHTPLTLTTHLSLLLSFPLRSYMHCEWVGEDDVLAEAGGKARLQRWQKTWAGLQEEFLYDSVKAAEWEPYPPEWTQVDRIIASKEEQEIGAAPQVMYLVKWQQLSYADASWELAEDLADDEALSAFERVQRLPTNPLHLNKLPRPAAA